MIKEVTGWAVAGPNGILINTISDTRRAAIVNFIVTVGKTMVLDRHTDERIEQMWDRLKGEHRAIEIRVLADEP